MSAEYRSSVLQCNVEETHCPVCEFLSGKRDEDTMLHVIRILDSSLAAEETYSRDLLRRVINRLEGQERPL